MSYKCNYLNKNECDACGGCDELENKLICSCCEQPIKEEFYYDIDNSIFCKDCLDMVFRCEKELNEQ